MGGVNYTYAVRGDGQATNEPLPTETQRAALAAVTQTLQPGFLALPDKIIALIPPRPPGYERDRELFDPHTGLGVRSAGGSGELGELRARPCCSIRSGLRGWWSKCAWQEHAGGERNFRRGAGGRGYTTKAQNEYEAELARMVETQCLQHLFRLAADTEAQSQVNAEALREITVLGYRWRRAPRAFSAQSSHEQHLLWLTDNFRLHPKEYQPSKSSRIPEGSPIGCGGPEFARAAGDR